MKCYTSGCRKTATRKRRNIRICEDCAKAIKRRKLRWLPIEQIVGFIPNVFDKEAPIPVYRDYYVRV